MKNLFISIIFIIIITFIIQYYLSSYILSDDNKFIRDSKSKFYFSSIIALIFGILEVFVTDFWDNTIHYNYYIILLLLIFLFYYLYKIQYNVYIKDYKENMIEHLSHTLFLNKQVLKKINKEDSEIVKNIDKNIKSNINNLDKLNT